MSFEKHSTANQTPDIQQTDSLQDSIYKLKLEDSFSHALQNQYISSLHWPKRSQVFWWTKYEDNLNRIYFPFDNQKKVLQWRWKPVRDKHISRLWFLERNSKNTDLYDFKLYEKWIGSTELNDENELFHLKIDTSKSKAWESISYEYDDEDINKEEIQKYLKSAKHFLTSYRWEQEHLVRKSKVADIRRREFEERKRLDAEGLLEGM